ncbi:unnamed protein product [Polarella glacialis]|uniref:Uncharacterized protein n=1 Tax=Polarella glacialis TaxID=89957 RepID=A0A813G6G9_POLGL|nr:unnamed protein product [Polarella glacialis]
MAQKRSGSTAMPKLQSQQNAAAEEAVATAASHRNVDHSPKDAVANTAQRACGRCLVKGDVVYTTVNTGAGYVAMCDFSPELCNTMGIYQGIGGAVAESKNAAEHNAASAVLSVLGVERGPKKSKVSTEAPIQSPLGLQGPPSGAKTAMPKLQSQQNAVAAVNHSPKEAVANTAQRACGRCLVKGDVVYTTVDTGAGYVAMCDFSPELCNTMGIYQVIGGAVAESKKAAEHNAASAVLSALGVERGPKKSKVSTEAPIQSPLGLQGPPSGAKTAMPKLQSQQNAAAAVNHPPKKAVANTAQRACGRCLVKGDVVYTTVDTGAGYVAMCNFSPELCNTMGIHQGMGGAVAESKNAAEHNAASAVLSVLGVECGPKKNKVSTEAPIQSPLGLQGPPSGAKTAMPKLQSQQNAAAAVNHPPKKAVANTAQRACGRCLVKGDVVYTTVDTGAGYVAMCNFSLELCNTMGIHQGMGGAVAESKNAAEHNAAGAVLSVLGVECGPKKSKVSTEAPIQNPLGLQGPPSGAKTAMPKLQSQQNVEPRPFLNSSPANTISSYVKDPGLLPLQRDSLTRDSSRFKSAWPEQGEVGRARLRTPSPEWRTYSYHLLPLQSLPLQGLPLSCPPCCRQPWADSFDFEIPEEDYQRQQPGSKPRRREKNAAGTGVSELVALHLPFAEQLC